MTAGYSTTALAQKLGIKAGVVISIINAPKNYFELLPDILKMVTIDNSRTTKKDIIHFFTKENQQYIAKLTEMKQQIKPNGVIWISWPKRSSNVTTDLTGDMVRKYALQVGLVDIKVCAIDEIWSGLKLVIPVKDRGSSV